MILLTKKKEIIWSPGKNPTLAGQITVKSLRNQVLVCCLNHLIFIGETFLMVETLEAGLIYDINHVLTKKTGKNLVPCKEIQHWLAYLW